jgi:hypothetical protein
LLLFFFLFFNQAIAIEKQGAGKKEGRRLTSEQKRKEDGAVRCFHAIMEQERRVFSSLFSAASSIY